MYLLSCSRSTLHRYIKRGVLKPIKFDRAVRFSPESILAFVAAKQNRKGKMTMLTAEDKERIKAEILAKCDLVADCWIYQGASNKYGYVWIHCR